MRPSLIPFPGPAQVSFVLFATLVLAALQNITVDDAVSAGLVVPAYLPSQSDWNIGNECPTCYVQPNASLAYDGTWHDCTFSPTGGYTQSIEFTFVGSGLYIFFILANTVPDATTLTNVTFNLDGVQVSSFAHTPSTSTDFEYNQAVFANDSIPYGQHTMTVVPVNDSSVGNVLILFDYLIYTTDASTTTTISSGGPTSSQSSSPTSPSSATTSSGSNTGAIIGGTIAGVSALVLVIASMLCYRRYKRRTAEQSSPLITASVEPFVLSSEMAPTSMQGATLPIQQGVIGSPLTESQSKHRPTASASSGATQPLNAPSNSTQSPSALPHGAAAEILEQVGMLRDEVNRLQRLHTSSHQDMGWNASEVGSEPPPEYA